MLTLPFVIYFFCGLIAALSSRQLVRVILAWIAHICLLYMALLTGWFLISLFPLGLLVLIVLIGLLTKCWMTLFAVEKLAEQDASPNH